MKIAFRYLFVLVFALIALQSAPNTTSTSSVVVTVNHLVSDVTAKQDAEDARWAGLVSVHNAKQERDHKQYEINMHLQIAKRSISQLPQSLNRG